MLKELMKYGVITVLGYAFIFSATAFWSKLLAWIRVPAISRF